MEILLANSYKVALRAKMERLKERRGQAVSYQKMAEACGIQKTYLSRLFHDDKTHLNGDQLFACMKYLGMTGEEEDLTELLWNWERATLGERRKLLKSRIDAFVKAHQQASKVVSARKVREDGDDFREYFLDPFQQLVHTFLMVPRYRDNPDSIARKLGITQARFNTIIKKLLRLQVIKPQGKTYIATQTRLHLTPDSSVYYPYRALMRLRSLDLMQRRSQDESYGLSVLFTGSEESRKKVHARFLDFLRSIEREVAADADENVYQLNFDLLSWTD